MRGGSAVVRFGACLALAGLAGCASSGGGPPSPARAAASSAAASAGAVMAQQTGRVPVRQVAALVVGARGETTVDALAVTGTTYGGAATLRITVDHESGTLAHDRVSECFRYDFRHSLDDHVPHRLSRCPGGAPIALRPSPPPPGVSDKTAATVRRVLAALSGAQRRDPAAVRRQLVRAVGPGVQIDVQATGRGLSVSVRSADQCLSASVSAAGAVTVGQPAHGTSCRGG